MAIERWRPARELARISRLMDDLMQDFFRFSYSPFFEREEYVMYPVLDVSEDEKEIQIKAELPGVEKENIKVCVENNVLTISGEKKAEKTSESRNYHIVERRFGSFRRAITLPATVDADKIKATYKDGILTITLPKKEEARAKEIKISTE